MAKHKNVPAVTEAARQAGRQIAVAGIAGRRLTALMAEGDKIASELGNGTQRSLQLVSAQGGFSATHQRLERVWLEMLFGSPLAPSQI